ncbi:hypothetical protein BGX23_001115 [Mortierella sp. AD031]|nr:hypothetical protein BGX23_001115 [Mortierella sp. AD031]
MLSKSTNSKPRIPISTFSPGDEARKISFLASILFSEDDDQAPKTSTFASDLFREEDETPKALILSSAFYPDDDDDDDDEAPRHIKPSEQARSKAANVLTFAHSKDPARQKYSEPSKTVCSVCSMKEIRSTCLECQGCFPGCCEFLG